MPDWTVDKYCDARGRVPVDDYLNGLPPKDHARVLRAIDLLVDYGPMLKMPHASHVQGKLWELRIDGRPNSYRVIYAGVPRRKFMLLHAFAKKGQRTPRAEIDTAQHRLDDYLESEA